MKKIGPFQHDLAPQVAGGFTSGQLDHLKEQYRQEFTAVNCGEINQLPVIVISRDDDPIIAWNGSEWMPGVASTPAEAEWFARLLVCYCRQRHLTLAEVDLESAREFFAIQPRFEAAYHDCHHVVLVTNPTGDHWIAATCDNPAEAVRATEIVVRQWTVRQSLRDAMDGLIRAQIRPSTMMSNNARAQDGLPEITNSVTGRSV